MRDTHTNGATLAAPQTFGRVLRRRQVAELTNHSLNWVDLEASRKGTVLVKVYNSVGRSIGFTEESVRKLLGCPISKGGAQ